MDIDVECAGKLGEGGLGDGFLAQAENVPARQKDTLVVVSGDLSKEAGRLRQAAREKNVEAANESLRKLQLTVRQLSAEK